MNYLRYAIRKIFIERDEVSTRRIHSFQPPTWVIFLYMLGWYPHNISIAIGTKQIPNYNTLYRMDFELV